MSSLLLACALFGTADAASPQDAFDQGVAATQAGDQAAAEAAFRAALEAGGIDPAVYHGLGNALYRQGELGLAVAAWSRGLQLDPDDADLSANLGYARRTAADRIDPPRPRTGPFFWQVVVPARVEALAAGVLAALGLSGQLLLLLRRPGAGLRWEAILAVLLAMVLAVSASLHAQVPPPATVLAAEVRVRSALGAEGVELFVLHEGALVRTLEHAAGTVGEGQPGGAVLIELPDGRKGWVPAQAVDIARPEAPFPTR